MIDKYCPTCDPALKSMSRIVDAREHDAKVAWDMVRGRDAEIERLRNKLNTDSQNFEIECHKATIDTLRRELAEARRLLDNAALIVRPDSPMQRSWLHQYGAFKSAADQPSGC